MLHVYLHLQRMKFKLFSSEIYYGQETVINIKNIILMNNFMSFLLPVFLSR